MTDTNHAFSAVVCEIPLDLLDANPLNPRKTFDDASLVELAASIRQFGVTNPLIVRIAPETEHLPEPRYEIISGHRRSDAATLAGLQAVPCILRDLDDAAAAEVGLIDNLQRVDVPPIEEAEAFNELFERLGSIPSVATKVGKEQSYIAKRMRLLALTIYSREALRTQLITIDHALLLARLAEAEQDEALKWCLDRNAGAKKPVDKVIAERLNPRVREDDEDEPGTRPSSTWRWESETVQRLKEHIECESGTLLDRAPWPMEEDWLLPDAGSCLDCEKNTKANAPLFGDLGFGVPVCTDGACFKEKTQAFVLHGIATAKKAAPEFDVLRVSWKSTSQPPRLDKSSGFPVETQTFKDGQWEEAKKKCEFARPAVTVDWSDANQRGYMGDEKKLRRPGEIVSACIAAKCKVHAKAWTKPQGAKSIAGRREDANELAERREKTRQAALAETNIRIRLAIEAIGRIKKLPDHLFRKTMVDQLPEGSELKAIEEICPGVEKALLTAKLDSLEFARAFATSTLIGRYVEVFEGWPETQFRREFIKQLQDLGYDASKAWDKPKEPKPSAKKTAKPAAKKAAKKPAKKAVKK